MSEMKQWVREHMKPIRASTTGDVDGVVDVVDENGRTIAYVQYGSYSSDHSDEECEANGLLIALCPDMYEVIKELLKFNEALDDDFGQGIIASEDTGKIYECILEKARQIKQKVELILEA